MVWNVEKERRRQWQHQSQGSKSFQIYALYINGIHTDISIVFPFKNHFKMEKIINRVQLSI